MPIDNDDELFVVVVLIHTRMKYVHQLAPENWH